MFHLIFLISAWAFFWIYRLQCISWFSVCIKSQVSIRTYQAQAIPKVGKLFCAIRNFVAAYFSA